jgi:signal transduction histidine kinase
MEKNRRQSILSWSLLLALVGFCAVLGTLQYRWIAEVSIAARERLRGDLETNLRRLSRDFSSQIASACQRLMPTGPEQSAKSAEADVTDRYLAWKAEGQSRMFRAIAFAARVDDLLELRSLDLTSGMFRTADWPVEWSGLHHRLESRLSPHPPPRSGTGMGSSLVFEAPLWGPDGDGPFGRREAGWLIFDLDASYLRDVLLPGMIQRHLGSRDGSEFEVEVVDARDPASVIYPAHEDLTKVHDASVGLLGISSAMPGERNRGSRPGAEFGGPERGPGGPPFGGPPPDSGRWRMYARSRAGSLEALVARARWLNIFVTTGILLLIVATMGALILFTRRARRLAELQMEFVAGVSHELRTPLTVIHTAAYNLRGSVANHPKQVERYGEVIQRESARLTELVEQILQFASVRAGMVIRERAAVSVSQVIEAASQEVHSVMEQRGCVLEQSVDPFLPSVLGDSTALKQAIANLLSNAAKYGGENHWVGVSASKCRQNGRDVVEIRVLDRGPGIPDDERKRIFEPFFRGRSAVRDQVHGTGLGLNLVKRVVEAHHGSVHVESPPFEGAEFIVRLPAATSGESHAEESHANSLG